MYLTSETYGNRLITHCQVPLSQALGSLTPPHSSFLDLRAAPGWLMLQWLWKSKNVGAKRRVVKYTCSWANFRTPCDIEGYRGVSRHDTQVGVEDDASKIELEVKR